MTSVAAWFGGTNDYSCYTAETLCMKGNVEGEDVLLQLMKEKIADNMILGMAPFASQTAY